MAKIIATICACGTILLLGFDLATLLLVGFEMFIIFGISVSYQLESERIEAIRKINEKL